VKQEQEAYRKFSGSVQNWQDKQYRYSQALEKEWEGAGGDRYRKAQKEMDEALQAIEENARKAASEPKGKSRKKRQIFLGSPPEDDTSSLFSSVGWSNAEGAADLVGFGNCDFLTPEFNAIESAEGAAIFYLSILRQQCCHLQVAHALKLVKQGVLVLNAYKSLEIPSDCPLLKMSKLTKQEAQDLSKAFELAAFSQVYVSNQRPSTELVVKGNPTWAHLFFDMFLHSLTKAKETAPDHLVLLTRNLYSTLKAALIKHLQQYQILQSCKGSPPAKIALVKKGIERLLSMQHFLAYNFYGVETTKDLLTEYVNFKWLNHKAIDVIMKAYIP
jgi:hypothetical protein